MFPPSLIRRALCVAALLAAGPLQAQAPATADDPYLWLEDVTGERALSWVRERNAASAKEFAADPRFEPLRRALQATLESRERIPAVELQGPQLTNFWRDAEHPRGLWRSTTPAEFRKPQPAWETLLDLDALAAAEKVTVPATVAVAFTGCVVMLGATAGSVTVSVATALWAALASAPTMREAPVCELTTHFLRSSLSSVILPEIVCEYAPPIVTRCSRFKSASGVRS